MNIKLPGSLKVKKIILIILIILSVCVIFYELIQNKNNKKENNNFTQEEFISTNDSKNENKDNSAEDILNTDVSEEGTGNDKENIYSEEEEVLYNDAYNMFFSNKYEEAIKKSDILVKKYPQNPKGYNIRGIAKAYNGDYDGGIKDINKSLEISPDYGYALFNKGLTYELYGNMEEALKWYNKDLEIEEYEWTYYGIASIYGRRGDTENTVKYLKKAIEINPLTADDAKTEKDFDPVRGSGEFESLING